MRDIDELVAHIRRARDWAQAEQERCSAVAAGAGAGPENLEGFEKSMDARAYHVVRKVLDEILDPGKQ